MVIWTLGNKPKWKINQIEMLSVKKIYSKDLCEISAILLQSQCVNDFMWLQFHILVIWTWCINWKAFDWQKKQRMSIQCCTIKVLINKTWKKLDTVILRGELLEQAVRDTDLPFHGIVSEKRNLMIADIRLLNFKEIQEG